MSGISAGQMIDGRYRVISRVGAGGMADVFLAEDQQLRRNVALKLLHRRFAEDPGFVERFRREAQAAASLQHPNVVSVFDRGGFDGTYYIAMEYLQGRSLKALIRQEAPLDPVRAIDITIQILKATRFAHRRGVIHRDLKPHNVIIDEQDHAKVTDFGIARAGASDMTETGSIMGTAQYLSPEQAQGHAVSEASDLYSIGVVLYEMLTGRVPFDADSAVTIALKHVSEAPIPPSRLNPAVPQALEQVVLWVLNKNPADRPADADQFLSVLEQVRESILAGGGGQVTASMAAVGARGPIPSAAPLAVVGPPTTALVAYEGSRAPVLAGETALVNGDGRPPREPDDEGGNPWLWVAAFLILLLLAGGGVAAYLLTRPAPKVRVPTVVNLTEASAQTAVQNAGLYANVLPETSSAPVNQVIGQYPLGGAQVAKGSTVSLSVSEGPGDVNVPSVVGLKQSAAQRQLELSGLTTGKVLGQSSNTVATGRVVATSPLAGQQVIKGYGVTLYISTGKGPANVPDVTGDTVAAAKSLLSGAGFKVKVTTQPTTTSQPGDVISQLPAGSSSATYGSTVTLTVASVPTTAPVPSVVGFTAPAAQSALSGAGFKVTTSTKIVKKQNEDGLVVSQSPRSGSTAKKGSSVALQIGTFVPPPITTTTPGSTTTTPGSTTTTASTTTTTTTPNLTPTTTTTTIPTTPTTPTTGTGTTTPTTPATSTGTTPGQ